MAMYLLFEAAHGYALFEVKQADELAQGSAGATALASDLARFSKAIALTGFVPFSTAAQALDEASAISEGGVTDTLKNFLQLNMPKVKEGKKPKFTLGVAEAKLGNAIQEQMGFPCACNEQTGELLRGVRAHAGHLTKNLATAEASRAQLGLAHSYSRAKVKFNVNRQDNMIIQAIALLDTLDKDVNTFVMRVREWYSWHFPELVRIVPDNYTYTRLALAIQEKGSLSDERKEELAEITGDEEVAQAIIEAAKTSMGQDISPIDLINIKTFAARVISLAEYRHKLHTYLLERMHNVAPNLSALIGEVVGARLISHAGSLTNLAKYPSSTVQILGAEKALFRALKTRGNTPKYGLIFHSSFIGRAKARNKGRISRYLANKASIASRIDCFMEVATSAFGDKMKEQVEERLRFYEEGVAPTKNLAAMQAAIATAGGKELLAAAAATAAAGATDADGAAPDTGGKKKKKKKRPAAEVAADAADATVEAPAEAEAPPKKKKAKAAAAAADGAVAMDTGEKKKKKKKAAAAE
jgi:nucleolar protein 56